MSAKAVIFDLGGVVLSSPLHTIARYEAENGIEVGLVNRVVLAAGSSGAWSRLERGEIGLDEFYDAFDADCERFGATIGARRLMAAIRANSTPRPQMLEAITAIRARGLKTVALTNNWKGDRGPRPELEPLFDVIVESSVVGLRKPDLRIYEHTLAQIGVKAHEAVFLDDIGRNLKPARELGMTTIKVEDPDRALDELAQVLGFALDRRGGDEIDGDGGLR